MRVIVAAVGQHAAGDDAVGFAVLDEIARRGVPRATELVRMRDAAELILLFEAPARVLVVDAILASPAGLVLNLELDDLSRRAPSPASSHGIGVVRAIELARALNPTSATDVRIVAVTIDRPDRYAFGLSPAVAAAVPRAAERVLSLLAERQPSS